MTKQRTNQWCGLWLLLTSGCAAVEQGRYGVDAVEIETSGDVDGEAVEACLVTVEREHFDLRLGITSTSCNEPPFDSSAPTWHLWRWPWTEWPTFNQAVFEQDKARILRWYRARGYYEASIEKVSIEPPEAAELRARSNCDPDQEVCTVSIVVKVRAGAPITVTSVELSSPTELEPELRRELDAVANDLRGQRFDEKHHDRLKRALQEKLEERGFAAAQVSGSVRISTGQRQARIVYELEPGPVYFWGKLEVKGHGELPIEPIRTAANFPEAQRYHSEVLRDIQSEVFALGAFSSVKVEKQLDEQARRVNVVMRVVPLPPDQLRLGVGVLSGATRRTETGELASIPQWDIHLFGKYERRNVFGSLARFRVDERPRIIFNDSFPDFTDPRFGNILGLHFEQPGLLGATGFQSTVWDYGPDAFLGFRRHDVLARIGLRRGLLKRKLSVSIALQQDFFLVPRSNNPTSDGSPTPVPYLYAFAEQDLRLDLRDDRIRPTLGAYFGVNATQAPRWALSDWTSFRLAPEARGYVPLPLDMVFATRFALGSIYVLEASPELDAISQRLGPTSYRLRGGGANSNRGFLPGRLGAGVQGGLRRWESSTELRLAFGPSLGLVGFFDMGDVNDSPILRFAHLNSSAGFGLRYYTVIGVLRFDMGFRIPRWQRADGSEGVEGGADTLPWSRVPGALHLTIGESF